MLQESSSHGNHLGCMLPSLTSPKRMIRYLACNFGTICNALQCLRYFSRARVGIKWHPKWETADMLQMHPDLHAHVQTFEEERMEQTVDPLNDEVDLDNRVNQGFEGNPQSLSDS
eukprot:309775-Pelagomonas_calceolata.AAC.1